MEGLEVMNMSWGGIKDNEDSRRVRRLWERARDCCVGVGSG